MTTLKDIKQKIKSRKTIKKDSNTVEKKVKKKDSIQKPKSKLKKKKTPKAQKKSARPGVHIDLTDDEIEMDLL